MGRLDAPLFPPLRLTLVALLIRYIRFQSVAHRLPLQILFQQPRQNVVARNVARPAVGVEHGPVEFFVGQLEPGGALVVEVGESALLGVTDLVTPF